MEYLQNHSESDGCDEHSSSGTESLKPSGCNSHTTSPASLVLCSKSMALDRNSPDSPLTAYVGSRGGSLNCKERLSMRKNLLSERLRELQARSQMSDNSATSISGDHAYHLRRLQAARYSQVNDVSAGSIRGGHACCLRDQRQARSRVYESSARSIRGDDAASGYLISSSGESCSSDQSEELYSYWPSHGRSPRIPFVWEEKPGRRKHSDITDRSFSDCNDEFSLNFSDEDSVDFMSAMDELPHSKTNTANPFRTVLKLPPRLRARTFSTSDQSRRSSFVAFSDDDTETPRLCYEDRMEITSIKNRSYFPRMQMPSSSGSITHDPNAKHHLNSGLQISDETRYIRRGIPVSAQTTTDKDDDGRFSPATNGLDFLLANFSPHESREQPGRFFNLREGILNAAIIEKSKRILHYHGRSNSRSSQCSSDKSDHESEHRNRSRNKSKQLARKKVLYTSFGSCGRSSDVIVTAQTNPY